MPTNTYDVIQSYTFASAASSVTLNTLPISYTNLRLVHVSPAVSSTPGRVTLRFNGDSDSNYHHLQWGASNTSTTSETSDNMTYAMIGYNSSSNNMQISEIHGYRSTSFNKSVYSHHGDTYPEVGVMLSTWNNTAVITSIQVLCFGTFPAGSNITLYGMVS